MGTIYPGAPGATGRQARARSLAEHATSNTTEEANDRCRTPDDSTAEDEHSDHNRTNLVPGQPTQQPRTIPAGHRSNSNETILLTNRPLDGHRRRRAKRAIPLPPPKGDFNELAPLIE